MLFSSIEFLFFFLPATVCVYFVAAKLISRELAMLWLAAASLFFYAWWDPPLLGLLLTSVFLNYGIGRLLMMQRSRPVLGAGIFINLALIGYFKYTNFFIGSANLAFGASVPAQDIVLPLAISFFTFQQIAYLVDVYQGKTADTNFVHYLLFVTFFPQLIAGPIVHHSETIPQFAKQSESPIRLQNLYIGGAIFLIGLYKKAVIADGIAPFADPVFNDAAQGAAPDLAEAWGAALAYTLQLYFDFSGYSDMAIGAARVFGIVLPLNFASPYKAASIIDFWRRWHMTLSRFLRDYLYVPLGGNRKGSARRYSNLMITMLLGGLWHGAGWTFVFWGGLHGLYLMINQGWRTLRRRSGADPDRSTPAGRAVSRLITFLAVVVAWVFFRAETWDAALLVLQGMAGLHGLVVPAAMIEGDAAMTGWLRTGDAPFLVGQGYSWIAVLLAIVWLAPNTQEWMDKWRPALGYEGASSDRISAAVSILRRPWLLPFVLTSAVVGPLIVFARGADIPRFIYMVF